MYGMNKCEEEIVPRQRVVASNAKIKPETVALEGSPQDTSRQLQSKHTANCTAVGFLPRPFSKTSPSFPKCYPK